MQATLKASHSLHEWMADESTELSSLWARARPSKYCSPFIGYNLKGHFICLDGLSSPKTFCRCSLNSYLAALASRIFLLWCIRPKFAGADVKALPLVRVNMTKVVAKLLERSYRVSSLILVWHWPKLEKWSGTPLKEPGNTSSMFLFKQHPTKLPTAHACNGQACMVKNFRRIDWVRVKAEPLDIKQSILSNCFHTLEDIRFLIWLHEEPERTSAQVNGRDLKNAYCRFNCR